MVKKIRVLAMPARLDDGGRETNPYPRILYLDVAKYGIEVDDFSVRRLFLHRWHVWHLHFPELSLSRRRSVSAALRLARFWLLVKVARWRGTRLIWTVHNLKPHEAQHPQLASYLLHMLIANLDALICLSPSGLTCLREQHYKSRRIPAYIIPHGHYRGAYPDEINKTEARRKLGLGEGPMILFVGQLRRYKNLPKLVACFRDAAATDWILVIAGEPRDPGIAEEVIREAADCSKIRIVADFIPDDCLQVYLRASDLVVLPYQDILNSGSAILALSFDRPVLVPRRGAMADLQAWIGENWIMTYEDDLSALTLRAAVAWSRTRIGAEQAPLEPLDWDHIRRMTAEVFRHTAARTHASAARHHCG